MRTLFAAMLAVALMGCGELKYTAVDLSFVTDARVKAGELAEQEKLVRDLENIIIGIASKNGKRDVRHVRRGYLLLIEVKDEERAQIESTVNQIRKLYGLDATSSRPVTPRPPPPGGGNGK